ncbi:hypothetical protein [uncultured Stenotrophomonas sp.]|uniref:hypothetical protein n=1 Tax=uncultured Stenotrophomonas sp. TaxID=165438 RepID=UPI0028EAD83A|nr:hypothetical protein [uncultured Stenotrophomonas sp.]
MTEFPKGPFDVVDDLFGTYRGWTEELKRATEPALRVQRQLHDHLERFRTEFNAWSENPATKEMVETLRKTLILVAEFPGRFQTQLLRLAQHGWYIDPEMPLTGIRSLNDAFEGGAADQASAELESYFRQNLDVIEERLLSRHPKRAHVLAAAFNAHRLGNYLLSIPVMLSQADGISHDERGRQLYSTRQTKGIGGLIDGLETSDLNRHLWEVFRTQSPLSSAIDTLPADFSGLNRHKVLHGMDYSYGSETNALRAVSLLNFASFALADRGGTLEGGN